VIGSLGRLECLAFSSRNDLSFVRTINFRTNVRCDVMDDDPGRLLGHKWHHMSSQAASIISGHRIGRVMWVCVFLVYPYWLQFHGSGGKPDVSGLRPGWDVDLLELVDVTRCVPALGPARGAAPHERTGHKRVVGYPVTCDG
jgi:hypothetical protein